MTHVEELLDEIRSVATDEHDKGLISDREFETAQADRRYARAAIEEGLLRRSLITAPRR